MHRSEVQVKGKVNAISMDQCTKTGLVFEDVVSSCELVNSSSVQAQVTGTVPTFAIDKCDGVQVKPLPIISRTVLTFPLLRNTAGCACLGSHH